MLGSAAIAPRGGSLVLDNTAGNTSAKPLAGLNDAATVTFLGGTLSLLGNSSGTSGNGRLLTLNASAANFSVTKRNSNSAATTLTFSNSGTFSLRVSTQMTVNFVGNGIAGNNVLGAGGNNPAILFVGTPFTGTNTGLLSNTVGSDTTIGWAIVTTNGDTNWGRLQCD